jgi:hypothetical protein
MGDFGVRGTYRREIRKLLFADAATAVIQRGRRTASREPRVCTVE